MGGAINGSFMSTNSLLSTYFFTSQTYKRMRLITRVYGIPEKIKEKYSGTSELWTPQDLLEVSVIGRCPLFRECTQ